MADDNDDKAIFVDHFNPDDHMKTDSPLIHHVYNNKELKAFKTIFHPFLKFIMYLL
jgi:hypothetical protein